MEENKDEGKRNRRGDEEFEECYEVGKKILAANNYTMTVKEFNKCYRNALGDKLPKTPSMIRGDREEITAKIKEELGRDVNWLSKNVKPKTVLAFSKQAANAINSVYKIYLCAADRQYCLYIRKPGRIIGKNYTLKKLKKKVNELVKIRKDGTLDKFTLVHLYIIFDQPGYEAIMVNLFMQNINDKKLLFTSQHQCCTEIVFPLRYLITIVESLFYTLSTKC